MEKAEYFTTQEYLREALVQVNYLPDLDPTGQYNFIKCQFLIGTIQEQATYGIAH